MLLAVPGLLATMVLAPLIIQFVYTKEFLPAVELLQWFILGCVGRVISWPLGFVMLALGKGRWYFITETGANMLHIVLIALALSFIGLEGVAIAFVVLYATYTPAVYAVAHHLTGFTWSAQSFRMILLTTLVLACTLAALMHLSFWAASAFGSVVTLGATLYCFHGLVQRIGTEHRVTRLACRFPMLRMVCKV